MPPSLRALSEFPGVTLLSNEQTPPDRPVMRAVLMMVVRGEGGAGDRDNLAPTLVTAVNAGPTSGAERFADRVEGGMAERAKVVRVLV